MIPHTILKTGGFCLLIATLTACGGGGDNSNPSNSGSSSSGGTSSSSSGGTACTVDCITGTTYYVSNAGDDGYDGLTPDTPWQTISKVNNSSFEPGDGILFKRGDIWREELVVSSSGTADAYIVYGSYGTGEKPKLYGSMRITSWTHVAGNLWISGTQVRDPTGGGPHDAAWREGAYGYPGGSWFEYLDGTVVWGHQEKYASVGDLSSLTADLDWTWIGPDKVYGALGDVYIYSSTDPNTVFAAHETSARQNIINLNHQEFIAIENLDMRYAQSRGVADQLPMQYSRGLIVQDNDISFFGVKESAAAYGISVWSSDAVIRNNTIHDCGRRAISYNVNAPAAYAIYDDPDFGLLVENVTIENNTMYNGFHTTGWDIAGSGDYPKTFRNFIIRNNLVYNEIASIPEDGVEEISSTSTFIDTAYELSTFSNFEIYDNIIKNNKGDCMQINGVSELSVHNNICYGIDEDYAFPLIRLTGTTYDVYFNNNIFVQTDPTSPLVRVSDYGGGVTRFSSMDNNIYFYLNGVPSYAYIFQFPGQGYPLSNYNSGQWNQYQSDTGFDLNSFYADPLFNDADNFDFSLQPSSPARDAGVLIPGYHCPTAGYQEGCKVWYGAHPDIGVVEFVE